MEVLRTKTVEQSVRDTEDPERRLRRSLGPIQLTAIGIGMIIGTGIFVLTGEAAGTLAGPGVLRDESRPAAPAGVLGRLAAVPVAVQDDDRHRPRGGGAFFLSLKTLAELVNIGTLFAFLLVSLGVIVLRRTRPDLERPFRVPLMPVVPILSALASAVAYVQPADRDVDPVWRVDGGWAGRVLRVLGTAQPAGGRRQPAPAGGDALDRGEPVAR